MVVAGWETTAYQRVLSVLLLVILLLHPNVLMERLSVTMDQLEDVGWETTVWLRVLSVLLHAIAQRQANVLMEKLSAT